MSSVPVITPTKSILGTSPIATPQVARFDLSIADVTNLFSVKKALLPALPNYAYIVNGLMALRSGDPYDTQPGAFVIGYGTTPNVTLLSANAATTFLITAASGLLPAVYHRAGGTGGITLACFSNSASNIGGQALIAQCLVGNPTVSGPNPGSPLTVLIQYEVWPVNSAVVGLP